MILAESGKPKKKSVIARRSRNMNIILLSIVLLLMVITAGIIINGINSRYAANFVRVHSIETADRFYAYISKDLTLVQKAARSKAITNWFADEENDDKKADAFAEMMDYAGVLHGAHMYLGIQETMNEYIVERESVFSDLVPFDHLDLHNNSDDWYFKCTGSENEYSLNIDTEKTTNTWRLWINHKVFSDGKLAGVFCSGLRIPDIFQDIFTDYDEKEIRGFIIDKNGVVQSASTDYGIYRKGNNNHIREENTDTAFAASLALYKERINGIFGFDSIPEIVKLSSGPYGYASIEPILSTDWSVVVIYNKFSLSGVTNLLPLILTLLAVLFIYVGARSALMNYLIFSPIKHLTASVSEGDTDLYGSGRNDEIGELARTIRGMRDARQRREQLMLAVKNASTLLLSPVNNQDEFKVSMLEGLELIGLSADVDRLHIWRNETIDGIFCYVSQFQWQRSDVSRWKQPAAVKRPYSEVSEWERKFLVNDIINGPVSGLSQQGRAVLEPQGVKSVLAIPLYWRNQFYGFYSFDDCSNERTFTDDEVNILRSAGLMIVSAMNHNLQAMQLHEAHERTRIMLNVTPLACSLWHRNGICFDCNEATVKLFNLNSKQEFLERFFDLSPEKQPDGSLSSDAAVLHILEAFEDGKCVFKWMHQMLDGTEIPSEVTLIRVPYGDEFVVAGYMRDLREHEKMMTEIEQRGNLLNVINRIAAAMLSPTDEKSFEETLLEGMEVMGRYLDADCVQIWPNEIINGSLHFVLRHKWVSGEYSHAPPVAIGTAIPYSERWKELFQKGECINGPISRLPGEDQELLGPLELMSTVTLPMFYKEKFWGVFCLDNYSRERYFTDDEIEILRSSGMILVNALNYNLQAMQLLEAHHQTQVLLDAMPFACNLWDRNLHIFGCNEENVRLFGLKNKQEFIDHFYELSPEYQPDGRPSTQKTEFVKKAFEEGRCVFEWIHQRMDGVLIPSEVTLVRVMYNNDYAVAAYIRDLREQKMMIDEISRSANLINTVNQVAAILFQSDISEFENTLRECMGMMGMAVGADRVSIWKNSTIDEKLYCTQVCEWVGDERLRTDRAIATNVSYEDNIPTWGELLSQSKYINKLTRDMLPIEQARMAMHGVLSVFSMPVFVHDEFWGFVGCDNCRNENVFSEEEASILRSGSIMIANALLRNDMTLNIQAAAAKLAAVIASYAGIIWCVDLNYVITLFNGQLLSEIGSIPAFFEGKHLDDVLTDKRFAGIRECIDNTFTEGPQDSTSLIDGKSYRIRTTPVCDDNGTMTSIMGTFDDVSERSRLQAELKEALDKAQEANRAKSSFLASMSHEMRTPLNAVIGLSELVIEDGGLTREIQENLEKIYGAGTTLLSTVNDILDISKIEAGKFEIIPVEYDIPSLINDAITQSIMRIGEKPIQFCLDISEELPARLRGDDLRVKQILNNLLSNAFKYTREGSVELGIDCSFEEDTVWMSVRVRDTGIGIKPEDMDRLFNEYAQVDTSSNRKIEGTGLGLSITKRIVEMMGGSVTVESEYGKGSIFTARFRQQFITGAIIGPEVVNSLKNFHYSEHKRRQNIRMARIALPYAHVLVVDDVATNLDVARGMMKPYGMVVDCVTSGQEAIEIIRDGSIKYNTIFMDHMMPGMDGIEATRIIREEIGTEYAKTVPIIALTANAIVGNEEMFLSKGFQAFLSKPIEIERLDSVIREWVRDKELEKSFTGRQICMDGQTYVDIRSGKERRAELERRGGLERRTLGKIIPGLDIGKGIERFGGDEDSFLHVLASYVVNTRPLIEKIRKVNKGNIADYAIAVHGIKGSSRGICAELMGTKAEILEKAAREKDLSYVLANNSAFINSAEKLINDIDKMLKEIAEDNPKPKKDKPDDSALEKLLEACKAYDMDGVDEAMESITGYDYESDGGLAQWLTENVDQMNFDLIIEKLSNAAE